MSELLNSVEFSGAAGIHDLIAALAGANPNTVEIGASHSLLLS
jgi:hypothetical protein